MTYKVLGLIVRVELVLFGTPLGFGGGGRGRERGEAG